MRRPGYLRSFGNSDDNLGWINFGTTNPCPPGQFQDARNGSCFNPGAAPRTLLPTPTPVRQAAPAPPPMPKLVPPSLPPPKPIVPMSVTAIKPPAGLLDQVIQQFQQLKQTIDPHLKRITQAIKQQLAKSKK